MLYCKFTAENSSEEILRIGQYLAKIWTKLCVVVFFDLHCSIILTLELCHCAESLKRYLVKCEVQQNTRYWHELDHTMMNIKSSL